MAQLTKHKRFQRSFELSEGDVQLPKLFGQTVPHTDLYKVPDAVPPIHAVSSHVATDKGPSKFQSIFSDNLQPITTRGKKAHGMLLVVIGCSSKCAPFSVSYYNEISVSHIGSCRCSEEGLCRPSTAPVVPQRWPGVGKTAVTELVA